MRASGSNRAKTRKTDANASTAATKFSNAACLTDELTRLAGVYRTARQKRLSIMPGSA